MRQTDDDIVVLKLGVMGISPYPLLPPDSQMLLQLSRSGVVLFWDSGPGNMAAASICQVLVSQDWGWGAYLSYLSIAVVINTMTKSNMTRKSLFGVHFHIVPSQKEVRTGTQVGQELGGRS